MQEVKEKNHENTRLHAPPEEGWQTFIEQHCSIHGLMKRSDFRINSKFTGPTCLDFYSFRDYIAMVSAIEHELPTP